MKTSKPPVWGENQWVPVSVCCVSVDHCMAKPDPGPCRAAFPMFYYNPVTESCQSFIYGGCRGNKNQYSSTEECMNHCGDTGKDTPIVHHSADILGILGCFQCDMQQSGNQ